MKRFIIFLVCCFVCVGAEGRAEWWGVGNDGSITFNIQAGENTDPWDIVFGGNEQVYYADVNYKFTFDLAFIDPDLDNIWVRITLEDANGVCFDTGRTTVSSGKNSFIFSPPEDGEYYLTVQLGYEENNGVSCVFSNMNVVETDEEFPYDESFSGWYVSDGYTDLYKQKIFVKPIINYVNTWDSIITKYVDVKAGSSYELSFDLGNVTALRVNICIQENEEPWDVIAAFSADALSAGSYKIILNSGRDLEGALLKIQMGYSENDGLEPWFTDPKVTEVESEYEAGYSSGIQYCIDNPEFCGLRPAKPDFTGDLPENIQSYLTLTKRSVPFYLSPGSYVKIFGSKGDDNINMEKFSQAEYIYSIGENTINFEEESSEFTIYRSGTTVYVCSSSGTKIKIAATKTPQNFRFANGTLILKIVGDNVMIGEQLVDETISSLTATPTEGNSLGIF